MVYCSDMWFCSFTFFSPLDFTRCLFCMSRLYHEATSNAGKNVHIKCVHMVWNWLFFESKKKIIGNSTQNICNIQVDICEIWWCFFSWTCHSKTKLNVFSVENNKSANNLKVKRLILWSVWVSKWLIQVNVRCLFNETNENKVTRTYNQNFKMVVLKFQLLVVFYLINGRYAYRGYLADDAKIHEISTNPSQIHFNEPPGKQIFVSIISN